MIQKGKFYETRFLKGDFEMASLFTELVRWFCSACHLYFGESHSVPSEDKNPAEVWAYMHLRTYRTDEEGNPLDWTEMSVPITHWESVIGRSKSCDISVADGTLSRNHGILMRDTGGKWIYRDLGSKTVHISTKRR